MAVTLVIKFKQYEFYTDDNTVIGSTKKEIKKIAIIKRWKKQNKHKTFCTPWLPRLPRSLYDPTQQSDVYSSSAMQICKL